MRSKTKLNFFQWL